jgi:hypothetical protein
MDRRDPHRSRPVRTRPIGEASAGGNGCQTAAPDGGAAAVAWLAIGLPRSAWRVGNEVAEAPRRALLGASLVHTMQSGGAG